MPAHRTGKTLNCSRCRSAFYRKASEVSKEPFCSQACYQAARAEQRESYPKIGGTHAHRVVAAQKLGRPLRPGEIVHHRDGNRQNFDPANLDVLPSQAEHARGHFLGTTQDQEHVRKRVESRRATLAARS